MSGRWKEYDLAGIPPAVRPETHWLHDVMGDGGQTGMPLWFSLQLSRDMAQQLFDAFSAKPKAGGRFADLIAKGARMAPASRAALALTLRSKARRATIGADILVPPPAFGALDALAGEGFAIADAGLAVECPSEEAAITTPMAAAIDHEAVVPDSAVIVATIDDGIGIANHRFRAAPDKTRIAHFLDMALPWAEAPTGPQPADELLGRSWTGQQINELLVQYPGDEAQIYDAMALIDTRSERRQPLRAAVSHGTHMLDTAAGFDYRGTAAATLANRPIIAVQLPTQVAEDRSDAWMPQSIKRALDWILVKADALSAEIAHAHGTPQGTRPRRLPLIVNCSCGSMAGPQDGYSDIERRISQFVETYRDGGDARLCTMVLSAGNSLQSRAAACLQPGTPEMAAPLFWRVQPDDKTPSFFQIWLPEVKAAGPQQVRVSLTPPRQAPAETAFTQLGKAIQWEDCDGTVYARLYHQRVARPEGRSRECITIAIRPTADDGDPVPVVPFGQWAIRIENDHLQADAQIDLHVHRDDAGLFARAKGRQSFFDHPGYQSFDPVTGRAKSDERLPPDAPVILRRTLSAYACGDGALVVGGYRRSDGEPAAYSSAGPTRSERTGPDIATVTEESPSLSGILASGTYSGATVVLNGTSVAAPLAVRRLAELVAAGGGVADLKQEAVQFETAPSGPQGAYCKAPRPLRFGVGRLPYVPASPYRIRTG